MHHVTSNEDFMSFEPQNSVQYKKLKNEEFTSLTLRITDQNNIITNGLQVTVVLHIRDSPKL